MFYSQSTGGFYDVEIHGDRIPGDAVEITTEEHRQLLEGQAGGLVIVAAADGRPMLIEPPTPDEQVLKERCKALAKRLLQDTDYTQMADVAQSLLNKAEFDAYRAAVRQIFRSPTPSPEWPQMPTAAWLAQ